MDKLELAKQIYKEIFQSIIKISKKHNIYCTPPSSIELDGVIYQAYICDREYAEYCKRAAAQGQRVMKGETVFFDKQFGNESVTK
jgi:hypothetical protein